MSRYQLLTALTTEPGVEGQDSAALGTNQFELSAASFAVFNPFAIVELALEAFHLSPDFSSGKLILNNKDLYRKAFILSNTIDYILILHSSRRRGLENSS